MIRIAVCDDEENTARLHQDKIREILSENRTVYETALYTRSDNLRCRESAGWRSRKRSVRICRM